MKKLLFLGLIVGLSTVFASAVEGSSAENSLSSTTTESYQIRNERYGDLLRPRGANGAEGTPIVLYPAQPWKCMTWKLEPAGGDAYRLQNHFTSKTFCTQAGDAGQHVAQIAVAKDAGERPTWKFTQLADGTYEIRDVKTGDALTAIKEGGSTHVVTAKWEDKPEQKWKLEKIDPAKLTM